jgi:transcriptional regulator with XRE-family HTH domain
VESVDRQALGEYVRFLRERQDARAFGFHDRRRTPGLRRDEVARLANISTVYLKNIEQGRGAKPSPQVLVGLADGLRLDAGQTKHLFDLAQEASPAPARPDTNPSQSILELLATFVTPALLLSARLDVIAQNPAAAELLEDFAVTSPARRNLPLRHFLPEPDDVGDAWTSDDLVAFRRFVTAQLRRAVTRYPRDEDTLALVQRLRSGSERFAADWAATHTGFASPAEPTSMQLGSKTVACDVLLVPEQDQYLVFLTPKAPTP